MFLDQCLLVVFNNLRHIHSSQIKLFFYPSLVTHTFYAYPIPATVELSPFFQIYLKCLTSVVNSVTSRMEQLVFIHNSLSVSQVFPILESDTTGTAAQFRNLGVILNPLPYSSTSQLLSGSAHYPLFLYLWYQHPRLGFHPLSPGFLQQLNNGRSCVHWAPLFPQLWRVCPPLP